MPQEVILLKLGEIALKGLNRKAFEDVLLKNIRRRLGKAGEFTVASRQSTIYVEPANDQADMDLAEERGAQGVRRGGLRQGGHRGKGPEKHPGAGRPVPGGGAGGGRHL